MDIKKADNKGRISGFIPNTYYRLDPSGRGVKVEKLWVELAIEEGTEPLNDSGIEYLASFGLDHRVILREECYPEGYWERELDEDGRPLVEYGATKKIRKPWPDYFDYRVFASKALMLED